MTDKIPTPQQLGLPPKFDRWRSNQEEMLSVMITSGKRTKAPCAPTGSGKSVVNVGFALWTKLPTCIVTRTKALEKQYMDDFESIGMVDLRGRSNYQCDMKPEDPAYTCEDGYAASCPYKGSVGCPSSAAEMAAASSSLVVTNYDKWTASKKYGMGMSHFSQVIFDEGHDAPDALSKAVQVILNQKEVEEGLQIDFPHQSTAEDMGVWRSWAAGAKTDAEAAMIVAKARISGISNPKSTWVKHYNHMKNLCRRLAMISTCVPSDWIVEELETGYQFDPIRPGKYAESHLLLRVPSVIVTSATLRPKTMYMLGIGKESFDFWEFDSDFDPKRCPIYYLPTMRVDAKADNLDMLWLRLDQIAARRRDRNGIVHTVSYARRESIMSASRYADSMIFNEQGKSLEDAIERFRAVYPGAILVTPSVEAGYDFAGKQCEWQVLCKIPFDPPSKILKAREEQDREYRAYNAMQRLVQTFGRGMRSKSDQAENFLLDSHAEWFIPKFKHLAPKSFHMFLRQISTVPQPPERL